MVELRLTLAENSLVVEADGVGPETWTLPVGTATLLDEFLNDHDPPAAADLTNALGTVHDYIEDLVVTHPTLAAVDTLIASGEAARVVARVELGRDDIELPARVSRVDLDEVFRTLVSERRADRLDNPGLPAEHVDTVVAACCVLLAAIRRFDLTSCQVE